ncbi:transaldolase family protein [Spirillospora sp. NPDC048819]|uniref:transaldolase family protein n=1 Tax=Spirillospora sp. NPDC048819 TaxID=3155268 RepID=UPI0033C273CC
MTTTFRDVIDTLGDAGGGTPAGFRIEVRDRHDGSAEIDLVRDIGYDRDGRSRPTPLLFSVDSVNPRDIAPWSNLVANMTCNPGIVYDLFLNDPTKNVNREYKTIDEVIGEVARILGPGCDVSVELHNPYETDFSVILEEVARYESILGRHRLVVKVPHTGPIGPSTYPSLLEGDGRFPLRYDQGHPRDYLRGHQLAYDLQERGYRVNFTLMFEPHQTPLALQARPYFINAFLRNRLGATRRMRGLIAAWDASGDEAFLVQLRSWMIGNDFLAPGDEDLDLIKVLSMAMSHLRQRQAPSGLDDGLDAARQSLRWLAGSNLPDSRLILCSMEGDDMFPDITRMLTEPEFVSLHHRVLITTDPVYLSRWTSSPQVVSYQRRFMKAAATQPV